MAAAREDLTKNSDSADLGVFREEIPETRCTCEATTKLEDEDDYD
jgi:hypothetical protein